MLHCLFSCYHFKKITGNRKYQLEIGGWFAFQILPKLLYQGNSLIHFSFHGQSQLFLPPCCVHEMQLRTLDCRNVECCHCYTWSLAAVFLEMSKMSILEVERLTCGLEGERMKRDNQDATWFTCLTISPWTTQLLGRANPTTSSISMLESSGDNQNEGERTGENCVVTSLTWTFLGSEPKSLPAGLEGSFGN